jgi:hypothetical protein
MDPAGTACAAAAAALAALLPCSGRITALLCTPLTRRLVADPDSPTSRLLERAARRSLANSAKNTPEKFSYLKDIVRNPDIARAARRALSSSPSACGSNGASAGPGATTSGASLQHLQFGKEIDHQTAVIDQLDTDAAAESRINQQMASVALGRLQSGRAAGERTLGTLQVGGPGGQPTAQQLNIVSLNTVSVSLSL